MEIVGVTTTVVPVSPPGVQVKPDDPVAVSVEEPPKQIAEGLGLALITGGVSTVTVTIAVLVHPLDAVPLTVKEVVAEILLVTVLPVKFPGFQV